MKKLLEIERGEELAKYRYLQYLITFLVFSLFFLVRGIDSSYYHIDFYFEFIFLVIVTRFHGRSQRNKNYAFWGFSLLIGLYLLKNILHFTFINSNLFILYFAFLAFLFLLINCYVMSSPLYYPRVQWWEYDFRYRGELKASVDVDGSRLPARIADLRRGAASVLLFETIPLGSILKLDIPFGGKDYALEGEVRTIREVIPGRPLRHGVTLKIESEAQKKDLYELEKIWKQKKKANLRKKFKDFEEQKSAE